MISLPLALRTPRLIPHSLLVVIVLFATWVRVQSLEHGLPYMDHWDEPVVVNTALGMFKAGSVAPKDGGYEANAYNYGGLTLYACLAIDWVHYGWLHLTEPNPPASRQAIETNLEGNYRSLSHPSFLVWNRFYAVACTVLLLVSVFAIGELLLGVWTGLMAAFICSLSSTLFWHGSLTTVDLPMVSWAMLCTYCTLRYAHHRTAAWRWWAFATCAAAIATKYTAGLLILTPLLAHAVVLKSKGKLTWQAMVVAGLTILGCWLLLNPYSLLDTQGFGFAIRQQMRLYKDAVGSVDYIQPGWPHALHQAQAIAADLHWMLFPAAALGFFLWAGGGRAQRYQLLLTLLFSVLTLGYLVTTSLSYSRNFLVAYPLLGLLAAVALGLLLDWPATKLSFPFVARVPAQKIALLRTAGIALLIAGCSWLGTHFWSVQINALPANQAGLDTRSWFVELLNRRLMQAPSSARVAVVFPLRMHPSDIARIKRPVDVIYPEAIQQAVRQYDVVVATHYASNGPELRDQDRRLNALLPRAMILDSVAGGPAQRDWINGGAAAPMLNPVLYLVADTMRARRPLSSLPSSDTLELDPAILHRTWVVPVRGDNVLAVDWEMRLSTLPLYLPPGDYQLLLDASAEEISGVAGKVAASLDSQAIGTYSLSPERDTLVMSFQLDTPSHVALHLHLYRSLPISREKVNAKVYGLRLVRSTRFTEDCGSSA